MNPSARRQRAGSGSAARASTSGASSATQSGWLNSSAKTCASGIIVIAKNQRFCPAKWLMLRARCRCRRRVSICGSVPVPAATLSHDHDPDQRAVEHDLERIELEADRPSGHRHRGETDDGADHPESGENGLRRGGRRDRAGF